jgi:hypothetical protein
MEIPVQMSDTDDTTIGKLNHMLYLQDTIRLECKSIIENQAKEEDLKLYTEHQALLNNLFIQHMELGLKASALLAMPYSKEISPVAGEAVIDVSSSPDEIGTEVLQRTLSCDSPED